jgi:pimeloyl-ACP methyl ester carboxylesterase
VNTVNKLYQLILLSLLLFAISGCSSSQYYNTVQIDTILERDSSQLGKLSSWSNQSIHALFEQCFTVQIQSVWSAANVLSCNNELLGRPDLDEIQRRDAINHYNQALSTLVKLALQKTKSQHLNITLKTLDEAYAVEQFLLLSEIQVLDEKLQFKEFGELGVLAIAERRNTQKGQDKFYPLEGIFRSVNFLFDSISYTNNAATINLTYQVLSAPTYISKGENSYVQKYSPSAAFLGLIEKADINGLSLLGLIQAAKTEFRRGIFAIEPISENKIPLIMTHGLNSDPLIWRHLTMALLNDPEINKHFQIWHFYYPSGPPPFFTSMKLRKRLMDLVNTIPNPKLTEKAVFIGHSMGGIITHLLTSESNYALWDSAFVARPEILVDEPNPELENIFIFSPVFTDNTVFFLDTPHLGSEVAASTIGYISSWLISLPYSFSNLFGSFTQRIGFDKLTPAMQPFISGPNSIQVLRPGHPMIQTLSELPVAGRAYSIIGSQDALDCSDPDDCNNISDSVVNYSSAHFPSAEQEIIVHSTHNSFDSEQGIEFIRQKLRNMLEEPLP